MDLAHVLILALLQGLTELFPVSSLGHTVIIPGLLGWKQTLDSPTFLPLVVTLHLGTALALLTFFWRDWLNLLRGGLRCILAGRFTPDVDPQGYGWQFALVLIGTLPAGAIGVVLKDPLTALFSQPIYAAAFLTANGVVLLLTESLLSRRRAAAVAVGGMATGVTSGVSMGATALAASSRGGDHGQMASGAGAGEIPLGEAPGERDGKSLDDVTVPQALLIGLAQSFALLPGISRSGATMAAGLGSGLSHESAARFSFLLATPLILAAGVLEVPSLATAGGNAFAYALLGGVVAGVAAYLSVRFLMRYFRTNRLNPFAWYCIGAGVLSFLYFATQSLHVLP
jgi:undecaprenyl-diphosphatase